MADKDEDFQLLFFDTFSKDSSEVYACNDILFV